MATPLPLVLPAVPYDVSDIPVTLPYTHTPRIELEGCAIFPHSTLDLHLMFLDPNKSRRGYQAMRKEGERKRKNQVQVKTGWGESRAQRRKESDMTPIHNSDDIQQMCGTITINLINSFHPDPVPR